MCTQTTTPVPLRDAYRLIQTDLFAVGDRHCGAGEWSWGRYCEAVDELDMRGVPRAVDRAYGAIRLEFFAPSIPDNEEEILRAARLNVGRLQEFLRSLNTDNEHLQRGQERMLAHLYLLATLYRLAPDPSVSMCRRSGEV